MSDIEARLKALNIVLPDAMPAVVAGYEPAFRPFVCTGNQIHLSGRLGKLDGDLLSGKVGEDISLEDAQFAARGAAIELLGVIKSALGGLDRVRRIVKLFVMVNGGRDFTEPHKVADAASGLFVEVFGEIGQHARSAVSVAHLPFGACVEMDMIAEFSGA